MQFTFLTVYSDEWGAFSGLDVGNDMKNMVIERAEWLVNLFSELIKSLVLKAGNW